MALSAILLSFFFITISSADILNNPDFESPPTNMPSNTTAPFLLLPTLNTIPDWSFTGTVRYVTSGPNISLPGSNGHAIQLGKGGKINQTIRGPKYYLPSYVLTFSLAPGNNKNCLNKTIAVNVSAAKISKVFSLQRRYGKEMWESYACYLGWYSEKKDLIINLEIESASVDLDANDTCSPIVDTFIIKTIGHSFWSDANLLYNGGFEVGPALLKNSTEGILLNEDPDDMGFYSAIDYWSVIGTVKYINTNYYSVPEGKAAVELVSDFPSGIRRTLYLTVGYKYTLNFTIGDANNSCLGEFIVYVQVGNDVNKFTMISNGKGSAKIYSMTFMAKLRETSISFASFNQSKTSDNVLCGPVIDNVILLPSPSPSPSNSTKSSRSNNSMKRSLLLFPCLFLILTIRLFV